MTSTSLHLRLGTRGSALAVAQSQLIADELMRVRVGLRVELVTITTTGDVVLDRPLHELGGKGLFTKEIEQSLLRGEIDFAVHSMKDVPVTMPLVPQQELVIAAVPLREDPADALVALSARSIKELPHGAAVGTGSLRRAAQLLNIRGDLRIVPIRGNIDSRLRKLRGGAFNAILLAAAGLRRLRLWDDAFMSRLDPDEFVPAGGQGALAIQCRRDDDSTRRILSTIDHADTRAAVEIERSVVQRLNGDCHSPIGVISSRRSEQWTSQAAVARRGGVPPVVRAMASHEQPVVIVEHLIAQLKSAGAMQLLHNE